MQWRVAAWHRRRSGALGPPVVAILAQAAVAVMLALTGAFGALLTYVGSALLIIGGLTVAALLFARHVLFQQQAEVFRVPGYPLTPVVLLILVMVSLVNGFIERPKPTGAALATILAGVVVYFIECGSGWPGGDTRSDTRQVMRDGV